MAAKAVRVTVVLVAIIILIAATAGAVIIMNNSNQPVGIVNVFVKDAASANWSHVNVTFSSVEVHQSGAGNDSGWRSLSIVNSTVDLKALDNISGLLAQGGITPGNYTQVRLIVTQVTGTMTNGSVIYMTVPSGELIINHPFSILANQTKVFTVDMDLDTSIVHADGQWIFKPVLGSISDS